MKASDKDKAVFQYLLCKSMDGEITSAEIHQFNTLFSTYPELEQYYLNSVQLMYLLPEARVTNNLDMPLESVVSINDLKELAAFEVNAPALDIPEQKGSQELIQKVVYPPSTNHKLSKFNIFSLAASAAIILFFVYLHFTSQKFSGEKVATLVDQINADWGQSNIALNIGDRLWTDNGPLSLSKGLISITYDEGVDVVIEGPALFNIERRSIYLEYGRLYGRVSERGLGFTVRTSSAQFTDMGTEFGVLADIKGTSELHVTRGRVQLFAGSKGQPKISRMVKENNAICYDVAKNIVNSIPIEKEAFVRKFDSQTNSIVRDYKEIYRADISGSILYAGKNGGSGIGMFGKSFWHVKNIGDKGYIRTGDAGYTRKGYLRFDISKSDFRVMDAILTLTVYDSKITANNTLRIYGLTDETLDNWNPDITNWSNAPAQITDTTSSWNADPTKSVALTDFTLTPADRSGKTVKISDPNLVKFINEDTNGRLTFIIGRLTESGDNVLFAGDDDTTSASPTLTIMR